MFTGIVEASGVVESVIPEKQNLHFTISCPFTAELRPDQSVAHNGVCLTVVAIQGNSYTVTAVRETLEKTNLSQVKEGDRLNLERCMVMNGRLDGHIVQGHVDQTATCTAVDEHGGSWLISFSYDTAGNNITVEKGSIAVNGVSLTVVNSSPGKFSVAVIPYTMEHTNLGDLKPGSEVNLEFDIIGKYVAALMAAKN